MLSLYTTQVVSSVAEATETKGVESTRLLLSLRGLKRDVSHPQDKGCLTSEDGAQL